MKKLNRFFKTVDDKGKKDNQNKENVKIKESQNTEFINSLQKQVIQKVPATTVQTAIRPGDGIGMNTKIGG